MNANDLGITVMIGLLDEGRTRSSAAHCPHLERKIVKLWIRIIAPGGQESCRGWRVVPR